MAKESNIIELEADVVFSNIFRPRQPKDQTKQPLYSIRVRFPKNDPQLSTIVSAAKKVLNKPKLKAHELGLDDGDTVLTKDGEPVAPGCWQLFASAGHTPPIILDKHGQRMDLTFEPGSGSRILLALKVTPYERTFQQGMGSVTAVCASYYLVKAVDIDLHPYEGVLTEEDKQYTFTRFQNQSAPEMEQTPARQQQAPAQPPAQNAPATQPSQNAAPNTSFWDANTAPQNFDNPDELDF